MRLVLRVAVLVCGALLSCGNDQGGTRKDAADTSPGEKKWQLVFSGLPGALVSVWGTSAHDVWAVGSDPSGGGGALVLHYDGNQWSRLRSGLSGNLWWVHGSDGVVYAGGEPGLVVRLGLDRIEILDTPSDHGTVFGVWAAGRDDVWAVGGDTSGSSGAFIWRFDGRRFARFLPAGLDLSAVGMVYKVWGASATDVWFAGTEGLLARFDGANAQVFPSSSSDPLFTVHVTSTRVSAVGGYDTGLLLERQGPSDLTRATLPAGTRQLFGVWSTGSDGGYAVGADAHVLKRSASGWKKVTTGLDTTKALHSVWVDDTDGVWAVGGDVLVPPLGEGVLIHYGTVLAREYQDIFVALARNQLDAGTPPEAGTGVEGSDASSGPNEAGNAEDDGGNAGDATLDASTDVPIVLWPPAGPGLAACGSSTCDLTVAQCCVDRTGAVEPSCVSLGSTCPNGSYPMTCDEGSDCSSGLVCCARRYIQFNAIADVICAVTCTDYRLCGAGIDCPAGTVCGPSTQVGGYSTCQ